MIHLRTSLLCLLAALGLAAAVSAQNLLTNPDFDASLGLTSWATGAGTWVLGADSGSCLLSNSAEGTSGDTGGGSQFLVLLSDQCVPVDPVATPTLYLGGLYKTSANVYVGLYLAFYSDGSCATQLSPSPYVFTFNSPTWNFLLGSVVIEPLAGSVKVRADFSPIVSGLPQYTGSYDRLYLGALPRIFIDGFETESGSACNWSSIVSGI